MIYESLKDNITAFVDAVGFVKKKQVIHLFGDQADKNMVGQVIKQLIRHGTLQEEEGDLLTTGRAIKLNNSMLKRKIDALWVVTSIGSQQIIDLSEISFPRCFLILLANGKSVELSACGKYQEAYMAQKKHELEKIRGGDDDMIYTVLVPSRDLGDSLEDFYFDNFCVLDENKKPSFYLWKGE